MWTKKMMTAARIALYLMLCSAWATAASAATPDETKTRQAYSITVQFQFDPSPFPGAPLGGAHPVGGPSQVFVDIANSYKVTTGIEFIVNSAFGTVDHANLYEAVAVGAAGGGFDAGISSSISNGHPFGELFTAGLPFGMSPDEYMTYLYEGEGLTLQQQLYDRAFNDNLVVIPVSITTGQGAGWFPQPLPDLEHLLHDKQLTPFNLPTAKDKLAMKQLCQQNMIVRWAEPSGLVWREACKSVGAPAALRPAKAQQTRCADATAPCGTPKNPKTFTPKGLTFGGFAPGVLPQSMLYSGNIDAQEFNLPTADIQFNRLALAKQRDVAIEDVPLKDISEVIAKAPYHYGSSWHQPLSYVELVINRAVWDNLPTAKQRVIKLMARNAVMTNMMARLNIQGDALQVLKKGGAIERRWPDGLLRVLRSVADQTLDGKAASLDDPSAAFDEGSAYRQVVQSQRDYIARQKIYFDFGDINQGLGRTPSSSAR